ncbi:MAG: cation diffusion facilitator family transporter [Deltaproteobacteria bacterium]
MHDHDHSQGNSQQRLAIALILTTSYMVVEFGGGILFNSLALLADAGHMLSDVMALGLSWAAIQIGKRSADDTHTFGFKRTEILAALFHGVALWAIVGIIFYEAAHRFFAPEQVRGLGMLTVASVGLAVNLIMAAVLFRSRRENLNIKGAFLHVVSDALGSMGAIVAALIIIMTGHNWVDPLVSVLIGILVLYASWGLVTESVRILMEGVPTGLDIREIEAKMVQLEGVCCVYDLHVWSITSNRHALSAHVVLAGEQDDRNRVLTELNAILEERFHIDHTTIQLEASHEMRPTCERRFCRPGTACTEFDASDRQV